MKLNKLIFIFILLFSCGISSAQDTILKTLISESKIILHVRIIGSSIGWTDINKSESIIHCIVIDVYKGINTKKNDTIAFSILSDIKLDSMNKTVFIPRYTVQKSREYIIFLSEINKSSHGSLDADFKNFKIQYPIYELSNKWFGIMDYNFLLETDLKNGLKLRE